MREFVNLKAKMKAGQKLASTFLRIERNPAVIYLAKQAGLDFILFDAEHGSYNLETIHDLCTTALSEQLPVLVRIPEGTKGFISTYLDAGAAGILVPMVGSAEYAERIAGYSKYPPVGYRGYTSSSCHTAYAGGVKHQEVMEEANNRILTIVQIETLEGLNNVDEIAGVDGIDMLFIGPNDLSVALGIPGDLMNPIELEAIAKVAAAAKKHGKLFSMAAGRALCEKFAKELDAYVIGADSAMLMNGMKNVRKTVDELAAQ